MTIQKYPNLVIGHKYGKLTLISWYLKEYISARNKKYNRIVWTCQCECNTEKTSDHLELNITSGEVVDCGCVYTASRQPTHDILTKERLYEEYVIHKKSMAKIQKEFGLSGDGVRNLMRSYGIARRTKIERFKGYNGISSEYFRRIRKNAEKRKFIFNISIQEMWDLFIKQNNRCALSGLKIELLEFGTMAKNLSGQTASLDRIDSSKGYTIDNVQWVHKDINKLKGNFSDESFVKYCKLVAKYKEENE